MNKDILFDLDGTLTDSGEGIMNCVQLALEHFGIPVPERDKLRVFVGPPLSDSFLRHGVPADKIEEAIAANRVRLCSFCADKDDITEETGVALE